MTDDSWAPRRNQPNRLGAGVLFFVVVAGCRGQNTEGALSTEALVLAETLSVGVLDGSEEYVLGSVRDVRALPDGSFLWETVVANLQPEKYTVEEGRPPGFQNPTEGAHVAASAVRLSSESILVQFRFWVGDRRNPDLLRIDSIELALADGQELSRQDNLPRITDISDGVFFSYENDPFSRVRVLRPIQPAGD